MIQEGWSADAALATVRSKADSTWHTYSSSVFKFLQFLHQAGFSSVDSVPENRIADYLCQLAADSECPQSVLRTFSAALHAYGLASGSDSFLTDNLFKVIDGLIKSKTVSPLQRSRVLPVLPFVKLFTSWVEDTNLTLENLRLKSVTLLALNAMLRPSDLPPRSGLLFSRDMIHVTEEGILEMTIHGVKNDYKRDGFLLRVHPSSNLFVCPVQSLMAYMAHTVLQAQAVGPRPPVFITLKAPHWPLSAKDISDILHQAIALSGLSPAEYTPKCFRPTGATRAIEAGMDPDQVQALGHWQNRDTFMKHYVHSRPDSQMTDNIMGFSQKDQPSPY